MQCQRCGQPIPDSIAECPTCSMTIALAGKVIRNARIDTFESEHLENIEVWLEFHDGTALRIMARGARVELRK